MPKKIKKDEPELTTEQAEERTRFALSEIGTTGLKRFGGSVEEEFLRELMGTLKTPVFREMRDNDAVIGAMMHAIEMMIRQVPWTVDSISDKPQDKEAADFLSSNMEDMSATWEDTIAEILSMLTFGWSTHEIVYKLRLGKQADPTKRSRFNDGRIGWRKLPIRAQETLEKWAFDESGGIRGMFQQSPTDTSTKFIPMNKMLLFRTTSHKGNPEGRSVLRNAFRSWWFKKNAENIMGIGIERDLAGLPVAWVPPRILDPNANAADQVRRREIEKIVTNIRRDEQDGLVLPLILDDKGNKLFDFELLSATGARQFNMVEVIGQFNQSITMTLLADFILLGHENTGSFALSSNKTSLFATSIGSWLDSIAAVFNRFAIPRLFSFNQFNIEELPILSHGDVESFDLTELGTFITTLTNAGADIFPDPDLEDFLKRQAGLPTSGNKEEI